ncbi:hypothetical protein CEXT_246461 [Caerostris extrusa]|uniref:Uncharacterized protein n=1 Tax=Caerostris extrusa TaxID=172846 RepID=A0AAV4XCB6_CAEEX|nr:hypothetical protein CEXT_246461 [Caerostris extrusa]
MSKHSSELSKCNEPYPHVMGTLNLNPLMMPFPSYGGTRGTSNSCSNKVIKGFNVTKPKCIRRSKKKQGDVQQLLLEHLRHLQILSSFICIKKNRMHILFFPPHPVLGEEKLLAEVVTRITRWKKMASHLKTPTSNDSLPQ